MHPHPLPQPKPVRNPLPRRLISAFALLLAGIAVISTGNGVLAQDTADSAESAAMEVDPRLANFRGLAIPKEETVITATVDGVLSEILVREDDVIEPGAVVARIDDSVQQAVVAASLIRKNSVARMESALAGLEVARIALDRRESAGASVVSPEELAEVNAEFRRAEADVKAAEDSSAVDAATYELELARLQQYTIRAPDWPSVVVQRLRSTGSAMRQSDEILVLADISRLKVEIPLPVSFDPPIEGRTYRLVAGHPVQRELEAVFMGVSPVLDRAGQSWRLRFEIDNTDLDLVAGFQVWLASLEPTD